MQVTHGLNPGAAFLQSVFGKRRRKPARPIPAEGSNTAVAEIAAYIAIRDRYLAEAEENPSEDALHRARIANELVRSYAETGADRLIRHNTFGRRTRSLSATVVRLCTAGSPRSQTRRGLFPQQHRRRRRPASDRYQVRENLVPAPDHRDRSR